MVKFLKKIAHSSDQKSYVTKLRKKRFKIFQDLVIKVPNKSKVQVLDLGGTPNYWKQVYDIENNPLNLEITLLNLGLPKELNPNFKYLTGDARDLSSIADKTFDICFSNSMIEHLGDLSQQYKSVQEMKRVAPLIYLQTPNLYFPMEPHYQVPFVQLLPISWRMKILSLFNKSTVEQEYKRYFSNPIQLLSKKDIKIFFDEQEFDISSEKLLFLTKSYVVASKS